jgi:hypothetical protein
MEGKALLAFELVYPHIYEHIQHGDGSLPHNVLISMLLFADKVILLASTPKSFRDSWMPYLAFVIFNS